MLSEFLLKGKKVDYIAWKMTLKPLTSGDLAFFGVASPTRYYFLSIMKGF